jgi:hypothetical protein
VVPDNVVEEGLHALILEGRAHADRHEGLRKSGPDVLFRGAAALKLLQAVAGARAYATTCSRGSGSRATSCVCEQRKRASTTRRDEAPARGVTLADARGHTNTSH